eukprot:snap_masked-scaffold_19-processed-gene-1.16-mRNA-1 protein AED:0.02 eAED:0.02 QI:45/1/1/1/1/1/3/117/258
MKTELNPTVIFSILNHFTRKSSSQPRVIGALVGYTENDILYIVDSFAVPHSENQSSKEEENDVALGKDSLKQLQKHFQHKIVGWYATSLDNKDTSSVDKNSFMIHDYFVSELNAAFHLIVDCSFKDSNSISIKGLYSDLEKDTEIGEIQASFDLVETKLSPRRDQRILLESLGLIINGKVSTAEKVKYSGSEKKLTDIEVTKLNNLLKVNKVDKDGLNKESKQFAKTFNQNVHDLLLAEYLSSLTKAQISVSQHLAEK